MLVLSVVVAVGKLQFIAVKMRGPVGEYSVRASKPHVLVPAHGVQNLPDAVFSMKEE